jgi:hypothetical protein
MANYVGGNKSVVDFKEVTAAANLVAHTFVNANGAVPANAAKCTGGVVQTDVLSGDYGSIAYGTGSVVKVLATGTVTDGNFVEILTSTFTTKDTTGVTGAGVQDASSTNAIVGKAQTGGSVNDTVLVELMDGLNH